jgi:GTP cyclohydrolase I
MKRLNDLWKETELLKRNDFSRLGNHSIDDCLDEGQRRQMISAASVKIEELFDILRIDHVNDHNTRDTPTRFAKMLVCETLEGRYSDPPKITEFENIGAFDQLIVTGPIELRSTCAHHLMPIHGSVFIGILPSKEGKIIGLSKYDRIVNYFAARLQIQEELVKQIGDFICEKTVPQGLAVRISAVHMCKTHRGVKASQASRMVTNAFYGRLESDAAKKSEFLQECAALEKF